MPVVCLGYTFWCRADPMLFDCPAKAAEPVSLTHRPVPDRVPGTGRKSLPVVSHWTDDLARAHI